jgi:putative transcriptional regulator
MRSSRKSNENCDADIRANKAIAAKRKNNAMPNKMKTNRVARDLVAGLDGFLADLKSDVPIEKKYTCRRVTLDLEPHAYTPDRVKSTRQILNASQEVFAQFLGVSVKAVRKWEGGGTPNDMAFRFMDEIQRNPEHWQKRLRESIKVRTASGGQVSRSNS